MSDFTKKMDDVMTSDSVDSATMADVMDEIMGVSSWVNRSNDVRHASYGIRLEIEGDVFMVTKGRTYAPMSELGIREVEIVCLGHHPGVNGAISSWYELAKLIDAAVVIARRTTFSDTSRLFDDFKKSLESS